MKGVILDADTLGVGIDLSPVENTLSELVSYPLTDPAQTPSRISDAEVVITNKVVLNRETLQQAPALKLVCVLATGMNNIDLDAARELNIEVRNVEAYGTASVAQHTLMMMLALATQQPVYQQKIAAGEWQASPMFCMLDPATIQLQGKKLVIVGSGELGQAVKTLAEAFGMQVIFTARPGKDDDPRPSLASLLPEADVISFHCPLTAATQDLLNRDNLTDCKKSVLIINNARGGIVNEADAVQALRDGVIGGLAADVLTHEPPQPGNPLVDAMQAQLNLIVMPHNAWTSPEARQNIIKLTAKNISGFTA